MSHRKNKARNRLSPSKRKSKTLKSCEYCGKIIRKKKPTAKYCSTACSKKANAQKRKMDDLQKANHKELKKRPCEMCGWCEASRDIHHIKPVSKGGTHNSFNLITLCPNHHRMADQGYIPESFLESLVKDRIRMIGI